MRHTFVNIVIFSAIGSIINLFTLRASLKRENRSLLLRWTKAWPTQNCGHYYDKELSQTNSNSSGKDSAEWDNQHIYAPTPPNNCLWTSNLSHIPISHLSICEELNPKTNFSWAPNMWKSKLRHSLLDGGLLQVVNTCILLVLLNICILILIEEPVKIVFSEKSEKRWQLEIKFSSKLPLFVNGLQVFNPWSQSGFEVVSWSLIGH